MAADAEMGTLCLGRLSRLQKQRTPLTAPYAAAPRPGPAVPDTQPPFPRQTENSALSLGQPLPLDCFFGRNPGRLCMVLFEGLGSTSEQQEVYLPLASPLFVQLNRKDATRRAKPAASSPTPPAPARPITPVAAASARKTAAAPPGDTDERGRGVRPSSEVLRPSTQRGWQQSYLYPSFRAPARKAASPRPHPWVMQTRERGVYVPPPTSRGTPESLESNRG
ncbi:LOW QUALITY PROTEIN: hypothetical protein CVT26_004608, partial [Gymnopilus dilepis]